MTPILNFLIEFLLIYTKYLEKKNIYYIVASSDIARSLNLEDFKILHPPLRNEEKFSKICKNKLENISYKSSKTLKKDIVFSVVGNFTEGKGQLEFLNYIKTCDFIEKDYNILIQFFGNSLNRHEAYENRLHKTSEQLREKFSNLQIHFFNDGFKNTAPYCKSDVVLVCSKKEGFSTVFFEAIASGSLLLTKPVSGCTDLEAYCKNCNLSNYFVKFEDFSELTLENIFAAQNKRKISDHHLIVDFINQFCGKMNFSKKITEIYNWTDV